MVVSTVVNIARRLLVQTAAVEFECLALLWLLQFPPESKDMHVWLNGESEFDECKVDEVLEAYRIKCFKNVSLKCDFLLKALIVVRLIMACNCECITSHSNLQFNKNI